MELCNWSSDQTMIVKVFYTFGSLFSFMQRFSMGISSNTLYIWTVPSTNRSLSHKNIEQLGIYGKYHSIGIVIVHTYTHVHT